LVFDNAAAPVLCNFTNRRATTGMVPNREFHAVERDRWEDAG
jgi:hypothetical protein